MSNYIRLDNITDKFGNSGFTFADDNDSETLFIDGTPEDDIELLKFVDMNGGDVSQDLLLFCSKFGKEIEINGTFYSNLEICNALSLRL